MYPSDGWNTNLIMNNFLPEDAMSILQIPIGSGNHIDTHLWHYETSGNYSVRSGYWKLNIPVKIKIFMWRACQDWIPTNFNITRRGVRSDGLCAACKTSMETTFHALWNCNRLKEIRKEWKLQTPSLGMDTGNFFDYVFDYFSKISGDNKELFCVLLWRIWFRRNSFAHGSSPVDSSDMIGWSKKFLEDYHAIDGKHGKMMNVAQVNNGLQTGWSPPDKDLYKTNCGIALDNSNRCVGMGIIIRNSAGEVMACCSQKVEANINKNIANLIAILRGFQFGIECGLNASKIESEDAIVVNWINQGVYRDSDFGTILSDIDAMRAVVSPISFCNIPSIVHRAALGLAKNALNINDDSFWMEDYPICISNIIEKDKPG
ncbi:hypothetical protein Dsin_009518 [Dipteronia sinensis]|uniref:Reverse transcriptase zinc-binding domain n=1 Tax=Dipteronia sinensis TaxID=43782 RepID=A0AAE0AQR7_9ROSI|nr:hypothetical protein Dsin_009518 [Dipteronia sinensis]